MRYLICLLSLYLLASTALANPILLTRDSDDNTENLCHSPTSKSYIHFIEPSQPNITLYIHVGWTVLYPKQLRPKLRRAGFNLTTPSKNLSNCGWNIVDEVSAISVDRGDIGFRQTKGLDANSTLVPTEETVARVREILLHTYPGLEIALILGFLVVLPISLCCCSVCFARKGRAPRPKKVKTPKTPKTPKNKATPAPTVQLMSVTPKSEELPAYSVEVKA